MTMIVSHELVRAFYKARLSCNPAEIASLIDDDIDWTISGPVDVLPYAGHRRGKEAVLRALVEEGPTSVKLRDLAIDNIGVDGDTAITRTRVIGTHRTGRAISYQCAQLIRFRDGKIVLFRAIIDSFDAAEQMLGRPFDVSAAPLVALTSSRPAV